MGGETLCKPWYVWNTTQHWGPKWPPPKPSAGARMRGVVATQNSSLLKLYFFNLCFFTMYNWIYSFDKLYFYQSQNQFILNCKGLQVQGPPAICNS